MKEEAGRIYSIAEENAYIPGCTASKIVWEENGYFIYHYSLAPNTDISAETYRTRKLWLILDGELTLCPEQNLVARAGDLVVTDVGTPIGVATKKGVIYTEIILKENSNMNQILKDGQIFALKDLLPVQPDKIVNMDLINDEKLKLVLMSFAPGTGLPEHAAPGEALIFALEGEGIIGYEGKEYTIKAGENFKFAKNGAHFVKANQEFKMALLLTLE